MNILLSILRLFGSLFLGILLYLGITVIVLGSVFVWREALLFFFNIDLYEIMKKWLPKSKQKVKKNVILNEESDTEWLKNRGRY